MTSGSSSLYNLDINGLRTCKYIIGVDYGTNHYHTATSVSNYGDTAYISNCTWETSRDYWTGSRYFQQEYLGNWYTEPSYRITQTDFANGEYTYTITPDLYTPSAVEIKRMEIKSNLTIIVKSRAELPKDIPENERVAMQTLRDMISETEFRKYIKDGFIMVRGQSGKYYQVFKNRAHTKVYLKGKLIEEICVRLKGSVPPTDNVIAFKTIIETDEEHFASLGNRYNMRVAA